MGAYVHPVMLVVAGWIAWLLTLVGGALSLADLRNLL